MLTQLLVLVLAGLAGVALLGAIFLLGMRAKSPLVQGPVIWATKRWLNPRQLRTAGQPGAYAAIIRNVGRSSGRVYDTPVGAFSIDGGFLVSLPYGTRPQWLRNVLEAGRATLVHEGRTWPVDRPEVIATDDVATLFPESERRGQRLYHVDRCLRLRIAADQAAATPAAGTAIAV